ncbi:MAG: DinB family protein [Gemmatimonadales bacterium]
MSTSGEVQHTLSAQVEDLVRQNEEVLQAVTGQCRSLSTDQLSWRPLPGTWSVGQILSHLTLTDQLYRPGMMGAVGAARSKGLRSTGPFKLGLMLGLFTRLLEPPVRFRMKAPRPFRPPPPAEEVKPGTLDDFVVEHGRIIELMRGAGGVDLASERFASPYTSLLKLTVYQALHIITSHARRHIWQIKRMIDDPSFPHVN